MKKYYKNRDEEADKKIKEMKEICKTEKFYEEYIREIVSKQKGELSVNSNYGGKEKISEGNWSIIEDSKIEKLDIEVISNKDIDAYDVLMGIEKYPEDRDDVRKMNAEYEYVFKPSFYAVITLIKYYLKDRNNALKVYNLKNAVVRKEIKEDKEIYYGGLPFILRYLDFLDKEEIKDELDKIKSEFAEIMEDIIECKSGLKANKIKDEFINDIIDCIKASKSSDLITEMRIKDSEKAKDKYIEYKTIDDYKILKHRDVEKDWKHLKEGQIKKANAIIDNTPKFPKNEPPKNDPLQANLKEWFSQRVSKKDRVVYKKDTTERVIYIATVCDHYKDAERRSKSKESYK